MQFFILGASDRTGQLVTTAALQNGHTVNALVRRPDALAPQSNLHIVKGTPQSQPDIEAAFTASITRNRPIDAVISTLNAARKTDSPFSEPVAPPMFVRDCVANAVAVMQAHGARKLVVMSAFGVGSSYAQLPFPMKALFRYSNMRWQIEDHDALDQGLREGTIGDAKVEWVLVRPARLVGGEGGGRGGGAKGQIREMVEEGVGVGWLGSVSRESVAGWLVQAAEGGKGWRRVVVVTS